MKTVLQVPLSVDLRRSAERKALEQGFSSLQEAVRVFLKKLSQGAMELIYKEEVTHLSAKAARRYGKIMEDIRSGKEKVYKAESVEDLMRQLHS